MGAVPNCGWGSHIIRQEKSCFKIRPAGPDFYGLWNKRNNDGAGGGNCVQCSEVRAGDCSGYLRTAPPQAHLLHSGDPEGIHQD